MLSHYHEAAYDAYMTGVCFAKILKFKEFDKGKPQQQAKDTKQQKNNTLSSTPSKEEDKKEEESKEAPRNP